MRLTSFWLLLGDWNSNWQAYLVPTTWHGRWEIQDNRCSSSDMRKMHVVALLNVSQPVYFWTSLFKFTMISVMVHWLLRKHFRTMRVETHMYVSCSLISNRKSRNAIREQTLHVHSLLEVENIVPVPAQELHCSTKYRLATIWTLCKVMW